MTTDAYPGVGDRVRVTYPRGQNDGRFHDNTGTIVMLKAGGNVAVIKLDTPVAVGDGRYEQITEETRYLVKV